MQEPGLGETGVVARGQLAGLAAEVSACRICQLQPLGPALPHAPRPVARLSDTARILVAGQAPGTRVHASGQPFTDPSGDRLRQWMGIGAEVFYDPARLAILPMGLCFPGLDARGGDLPPRRECRAAWHDRLMAAMPQIDLILAIGQYAQAYHLAGHPAAPLAAPFANPGASFGASPAAGRGLPTRAGSDSLTERVRRWREILARTGEAGPAVLVLPHPSWRNTAWLKRNPWFEAEVLPELRQRVASLI
ncbi:uracil-DNA glycosylase family protein [Microvirga tunisiensis]|uniref:Uracil-DNA glycosylase family protein n=1 Tax=Pannonibacter tanglangensis TaxID=2750084 RepID=A0A7X5F441_9HYPH|nr:uracil-DNA glycosylase family protein [Pannonibacter sp. XCT-53]NBN78400.1 uracil-DNA glycosylase family protein [Pannonibacter sp. XCT-53]